MQESAVSIRSPVHSLKDPLISVQGAAMPLLMGVVQRLTEMRGAIWLAKAIVLRLAVVVIDWMFTLMVVEALQQRAQQRQVHLRLHRQAAVILCLDGLSWDAIQITYLAAHCHFL
jgi:hypothetical protein